MTATFPFIPRKRSRDSYLKPTAENLSSPLVYVPYVRGREKKLSTKLPAKPSEGLPRCAITTRVRQFTVLVRPSPQCSVSL